MSVFLLDYIHPHPWLTVNFPHFIHFKTAVLAAYGLVSMSKQGYVFKN